MPIASLPRNLNFVWWNVESLAHFWPEQKVVERWPASAAEYVEKCRRVDAVLTRIAQLHERPSIVGLAEITSAAAHQLRDRMFPGYAVYSLDLHPKDPSFQVAILYDPSRGLKESLPLAAPNMPRTTRPMAAIDFVQENHTIRFIACHWTARMGEGKGEKEREQLAMYLREQIYDFVHDAPAGRIHDVIVMGDLNNEPFEGNFEDWHSFFRNRTRATQPEHYSDRDVRRIRLYNCAWRWLGEHWAHSHSGVKLPTIAGTYFRHETKDWYTFDQILVSGGLLTTGFPVLSEDHVLRFVDDTLFDRNGMLRKFNWNGGEPFGVSDHTPLVGRILYLQEH